MISKTVLWDRLGAVQEEMTLLNHCQNTYLFVYIIVCLLPAPCALLSLHDDALYARLSACEKRSFPSPSNSVPFNDLKIELIHKFMCILLFYPYHVMILAALLMDFLNQFNTK